MLISFKEAQKYSCGACEAITFVKQFVLVKLQRFVSYYV